MRQGSCRRVGGHAHVASLSEPQNGKDDVVSNSRTLASAGFAPVTTAAPPAAAGSVADVRGSVCRAL